MKFITDQEIEKHCSMSKAIELMRDAFQALSTGRAKVPLRTNLAVSETTCSLIMPVAIDGLSTFGLKAVSLADQNQSKGLPRIHGSILLFDSSTGIPVCRLGAEKITALRTGAAVGLATQWLAPENCDTAALFGTGNQASACIEALLSVRDLKTVLVFARNKTKGQKFCRAFQARFQIPFEYCDNQESLGRSQIICLATSSSCPVFDPIHLADTFHLNAIGSYQKDQLEFEPSILANARVFVDQKNACLTEAGEIVAAINQSEIRETDLTEIGDVLSGKVVDIGSGRTVFKSVGNAVQDLVVADYVYNQTKKEGNS